VWECCGVSQSGTLTCLPPLQCWKDKYSFNFWRPIIGIRRANEDPATAPYQVQLPRLPRNLILLLGDVFVCTWRLQVHVAHHQALAVGVLHTAGE
jgi:hypothetical protein